MLDATGLGRQIESAWIWRDLALSLGAGESLAIVGPTGVGKTLLLRCLCGLDAADAGTVALDGRDLDRWHIPSYRARVVYLHQRPALQEGTVEENLRAPFRLAAHRHRRYERARALEQLAAFERGERFLTRQTADLSGGESQIVALLRALGVAPSVLLVDEPTASMDVGSSEQAERLLTRWIRSGADRATIWTSHDADQVGRVADRTFELTPYPSRVS